MINNKAVEVVDELLYLGVRIGKNKKFGVDLEPQLRHIEKRMLASSNKILTMRNYGSKKQLTRLYNGLVVSYFSHGLDTQPFLSPKWYSKLQKIMCNFLKIITNQTHSVIHKPISQSILLYESSLKNFYNGHYYLLINRLNNVFLERKPSDLFDDLHPCLYSKNNILALSPFSKNKFSSNYERNKFLFLNKIGAYTTFMKIPDHLAINKKNPRFMKTWPYFMVDIYNKLPSHIKANLGTYQFKTESKSFFTAKCQHPYRKDTIKDKILQNNDFCKRCRPVISDNFTKTLNERRQVNKYLLHFKFDLFYNYKSKRDVFIHNFLIHHKQAEIFRRLNRGKNILAGQLFDKYGEDIMDWYPISTFGELIGPSLANENIFSLYTGKIY